MQAVIFDMDGVLVDSEPVHREVERGFFSEHGLPVGEEEHLGYLGMSSEGTFARIAALHPAEWRSSGLDVQRCIRVEQERYWEILSGGGVPFVAGSLALIRELRDAGWRVGVASSASRRQIEYILESGDLAGVVTCFRGAEDVRYAKPDPELFLSAAACLGTDPTACWVVEDSPNGVRAAIAAGMRCVGFTGSDSGEDCDATTVSADLSEATVVVDSMERVGAVIGPTLEKAPPN